MKSTTSSIKSVQAMVREAGPHLPFGGATKPALSAAAEGIHPIAMAEFSGVMAYEPGEFTFTALAGTPVAEVQALLAEHGQFLPFDPLLARRGATLGGTVAAGASGPGRYRYGGVRDFLLGVQFVDAAGNLVRGGGKVVKNAAGFDLPKLMTGSLGQFGVLVELIFKVFPSPEASLTLRQECSTLEQALAGIIRLGRSSVVLDALDLEVGETQPVLWVRLAGIRQALIDRARRVQDILGGGELIPEGEEAAVWENARELEWVPAGWSLVKVPVTPAQIPTLEASLAGCEALRRYSGGGQVGWIAVPGPQASLDEALRAQGLSGLALFGTPGAARLGVYQARPFFQRVKAALDPDRQFVEV